MSIFIDIGSDFGFLQKSSCDNFLPTRHCGKTTNVKVNNLALPVQDNLQAGLKAYGKTCTQMDYQP